MHTSASRRGCGRPGRPNGTAPELPLRLAPRRPPRGAPRAILAGLGLVGTAVYLIVRTVDCIKRGAQLDFQLQNFTLWFGTAVGAMATDLYVFADELIGVIFAIWLVTAVVGGLLVRFAPRHEENEP